MKKFIKSRSTWEILMVSLLAFFATVGVVLATTTIGTNITTDGSIYATSTLYVDGATTLNNTVTVSAANLKVSTGYGLDSTGAVLNLGTTTATTINIGSTGATVAIRGNMTFPTAYGLDSSGAVLNIGTTTATTINIGSVSATVALKGNMTFPTGYGIDAVSGVLNIGTTTATQVNIGSASGPVVMTNSSSTLANFGSGTTVSGLLWGTCAVDPQSITAATSSAVSTSCAATGMTSSYKVFVTPPADTISGDNWLVFEGASASTTAGYIEITLFNASTTASIDGPSRTWSWMAIK
ncbi:hypothetical protein KJ866_03465 [Patescibacteria group bacterium]|nr:hypothetical protein [Patescibacteria group bacterium]MBU2220125.1 hypothetical protein [Patescibacteria group bacterium]